MQSQRDYLFEILNRWRGGEREKLGGPYSNKIPGVKKPPRVLEAEARIKRDHKIVNKWQSKANAAHKKALNKVEEKYQRLRKAIHFEKPEAALKIIEKECR